MSIALTITNLSALPTTSTFPIAATNLLNAIATLFATATTPNKSSGIPEPAGSVMLSALPLMTLALSSRSSDAMMSAIATGGSPIPTTGLIALQTGFALLPPVPATPIFATSFTTLLVAYIGSGGYTPLP